MDERWVPIKGFERYEVSDHGRVRRVGMLRRAKGPIRLRRLTMSHGYHYVELFSADKKPFTKRVNRLVCEAFNGSPPTPGHHAAHNDGDRTNNHYSNLRWATPKENSSDVVQQGKSPKGIKHHCAKLSENDIHVIRGLLETGTTLTAIGKMFQVNRTTIARIKTNEGWAHVAHSAPP